MVATKKCNHLLPSVRPLARQSNEQRLEHIRTDRWIGYTRALDALGKLESLLTYPVRQRMPNLLLIGPTNNGKSMLIEKFCRDHPPFSRDAREPASIPVLAVQMPPSPDIKRFYGMILHQMDIRTVSSSSLTRLETHTLDMLETLSTRVLIIDEVHNVLSGSTRRQREFLNLLRFLGNELKIALVCAGIKDAYLAIRSDAQLENRFEPFVLPRWDDNDEYASLLASFESVLPLHKPSHLSKPALATAILARTEGTIGEITMLLTQAAVFAVESGQESIDQPVLDAVDYHSPTERKRLFERALA